MPSDAANLEFADKNLKLALLDEIQGKISWIERLEADYEQERGAHPTWPTWRAVTDVDNSHNEALEQYLLIQPVSAEALQQITRLSLDGDRQLYTWVYSFWWESGDHFTIRDLSGIEKCSKLEYLLLGQGLVEGCSLAPLASLGELEELHVCALGKFTDIESILDIPKLETIKVSNTATSEDREAWLHVMHELGRRSL